MKTPRFEGPFKWSALRKQLLSLREDVQSIRKIAGRNITVSEHPGKGTVINALSDRGSVPAPSPCVAALPAVGCATQVCFNFKPDQSEFDDGAMSGYAFELLSCGWWPDYTNARWTLDGVASSVTLPFTGTIPDVQHSVIIVWITNDDDTVTNYMVVDGVESSHMTDSSDLFDDGSGWVRFTVGSHFTDTVAHREISNLQIVSTDTANFPDGIVVNATTGSSIIARVSPDSTITSTPPDTHTTFTGSSISFSGGIWRVDNDAGASVFAEFTFCPVSDCRPAAPFRCCCKSALDQLSGITTITLDFAITGLCECGDITQTKVWDRVPIDTVPGDNEFRFVCNGDGRRATLDAGSDIGHGDALVMSVNDYPNPGDTLEVRVPIGAFAGAPDFEQPICRWSVTPCVTSGFTCVSPPAWSPGTTYATNAIVNSSGLIYISLQDGNLNHAPATEITWWALFGAGSHFPCSCSDSPDFCLDTTLLDLADVPGIHTYTDTARSCGSLTYDTSWTITFE